MVENQRAKREKDRLKPVVISDNGRNRTVKKVKTTCDRMVEARPQRLPRNLRNAVDAFSALVADGLGVAVYDDDDSTNKLTTNYDGYFSGSGFKSGAVPIEQLDGLRALKTVRERVPVELLAVFDQIVKEETGTIENQAKTLNQLGEDLGYTWKQAAPAGEVQIYCVCCIIAHYMREKGMSC